MRYDFWQSKQNIHFGGSNLNCISLASSVESFALATSISVYSIDHSQTQLHHLPWMFPQFLLCVVAQKMLKAFFVLISLCIHADHVPFSQNLL